VPATRASDTPPASSVAARTCGGRLAICLDDPSRLARGECDFATGEVYPRHTCSQFCEDDADCQAIDPATSCNDFGLCHRGCDADADCPDGSVCGTDATCVREDPPGVSCPEE
jgi:hypothetical protein